MTIIFEDLSKVKLSEKLRSFVAVGAASLTGLVIRKLKVGQGGTLPGRVLMALDPKSLTYLSRDVYSLVVSGTNGKTTTTAMISHILSNYRTYSNATGANMDFAIAFALSQRPTVSCEFSKAREIGVFEVDEAYLPTVAESIRSKVAVVLNLSRDQLDRNSEVRMVAKRWREFFEANKDIKIVANCDDPLVTYAALASKNTTYVAAGCSWNLDASSCPLCEAKICFDSTSWRCQSCDFERPEPTWNVSLEGDIYHEKQYQGRMNLSIPGKFNEGNALLALAGACALLNSIGEELDVKSSVVALSEFSGSGGRFATYCLDQFDGAMVRTYLAKNPAGWDALISTILASSKKCKVVMGLNANIADGTDTSWIWDVHFEELTDRFPEVVVVGDRRYDLAVRLAYADITPILQEGTQIEVLKGLELDEGTEVIYIGNYTAFFELQKELAN